MTLPGSFPQKTIAEPPRETPVVGETDVLVIGGGPAGVGAALAAARAQGLQVRSGTCAVMYLRGGFSHNVHKLFRKIARRW